MIKFAEAILKGETFHYLGTFEYDRAKPHYIFSMY